MRLEVHLIEPKPEETLAKGFDTNLEVIKTYFIIYVQRFHSIYRLKTFSKATKT